MFKEYRPWLRTISGIFQNFSAGWFGVAIITPNFTGITSLEDVLTLTLDILFGILFLLLSARLEKLLEYE